MDIVIADRLCADGRHRVLLIEAGGGAPDWRGFKPGWMKQ